MTDEKESPVSAKENKRQLKAPCMYMGWSERQKKEVEMYPSVNCTYSCDSCGWNPTVAEKRIAKMKSELGKETKKWLK